MLSRKRLLLAALAYAANRATPEQLDNLIDGIEVIPLRTKSRS